MNNFSLIQRLIFATLALLASCLSIVQVRVHAESAPPQIVINQFKITSSNGQFFMLYNNTTSTLDMSKFELRYFNNFDVSKSTSSKVIGLTGSLPSHGFYMVSDATTAVCYQAMVNSVSLGLSSTSGMIEVLSYSQSSPGGSIMPTLQDFVGWSKTAAVGAQTLPTSTNAFLQRTPTDASYYPVIATPGGGGWQAVQPDPNNPCKLITVSSSSSVGQAGTLLPATQPPAMVINLSVNSENIAPKNVGLSAPTISEILPNPNGIGTDSTDEFVEIYNSNDVSFDLGGYSLQTGLTSLHSIGFPEGTLLAAKSFTVFYAKDLNPSLSNSSGQALLLDPSGASISQTDSYGTAKDGQAWALAAGKWYWSTSPTPGTANVIVLPPSTAKAAVKSKLKASTSKSYTSTQKTDPIAAASLAPSSTKPLDRVPIHSGVLALVAGLALLYGAYEYRTDLGNRIHQLRSYIGSRRAHRLQA